MILEWNFVKVRKTFTVSELAKRLIIRHLVISLIFPSLLLSLSPSSGLPPFLSFLFSSLPLFHNASSYVFSSSSFSPFSTFPSSFHLFFPFPVMIYIFHVLRKSKPLENLRSHWFTYTNSTNTNETTNWRLVCTSIKKMSNMELIGTGYSKFTCIAFQACDPEARHFVFHPNTLSFWTEVPRFQNKPGAGSIRPTFE